MPAKAGIQRFCLDLLDSRLRGSDGFSVLAEDRCQSAYFNAEAQRIAEAERKAESGWYWNAVFRINPLPHPVFSAP